MASAALLLLLMHSCYKERPLTGDLLSIMVCGSSLFRQSFSILKVIPQPRVSNANLLVGDFPPTHHLSPQEKRAQEGEPGLWLFQPDSAVGKEGTWTWDRFSPETTWPLLLPPSHFLGDESVPVSLPNGTLTMFKAKKPVPYLINACCC